MPYLSVDARWSSQGVTILKDLKYPQGLVIDENDGKMYVADSDTHRIVAVTIDHYNGNHGSAVAGDNEIGNSLIQLNRPTDVLIDNKTRSLIICDHGNNRIMRWSLESGTTTGEILINNIIL